MMNQELQQDIKLRRQRLQQVMIAEGIDACVLSTPVNVFYMTGFVYNGYYYLSADGDYINFVRRPEGLDLDNFILIYKPELILDKLKEKGLTLPQKVYMETDQLSMNHCTRLTKALELKNVEDVSAMMRNLRMVKTDFEIKHLRVCAKKHQMVYKSIPSLYMRGMTDLELQIEIERKMRLHGSLGIFRTYGENMDIYMGSLLAGDNAATASPFDFALGGKGASPIMPLGSSGGVIREKQTIMVDMAGNYSPWMTDMTRVYSVGATTDLAYKAHKVSQEIDNEVMNKSKAGTPCSELWGIAYSLVEKYNLEKYFMGTNLQAKFVGHGVGLEINEPPVLMARSRDILTSNMVFALEPKFVIPEIGAVGIENTFLVTETGLEKITQFEENIIEL